jgi:Ca-activated chloride channel family protein
MKKNVLSAILLFSSLAAFCQDAGDASLNARIRYIAEQGGIVRPEDVAVDSYISSVNYRYPEPENGVGVYLYNSASAMSRDGGEGILQIGLRAKAEEFKDVPPLNMVLLVDTSSSMAAADKIAWVKNSMRIFMKKVRPVDSLSLVSFNDAVQVLFPAALMDTSERRQAFLDAMDGLNPRGGTNMEAGLKLGYEQAVVNSGPNTANIVILVSDGTDFSSRLSEAHARSGDIRASLSWNNRNDLDLHVITPNNEEISFRNKRDSSGGMLDVDMNVAGETTEPVENIFWSEMQAPKGTYKVYVQNYAYHESFAGPTPFQMELKIGNSFQYFDGVISGSGDSSTTHICTFDFSGGNKTQAQTFGVLRSYKEKGISLSTLAIGSDFDAAMMRILAEEARGSSRFLESQQVMLDIFGSDVEFERLAISAMQDLSLELDFLHGVEIVETWGYQNRTEGKSVYYQVPALHQGDYQTILVRYRLPPLSGDSVLLAALRMKAHDAGGNEVSFPEKQIRIALADTPDAASTATKEGIYSGSVLYFAENLKQIGEVYYGRAESRLQTAMQKTAECAAELEKARLMLNDPYAFSNESAILARYITTLSKEMADAGIGVVMPATVPQPAAASVKSRMSTGIGATSKMQF